MLRLFLMLFLVTASILAVHVSPSSGELQSGMPIVYVDPQAPSAPEGTLFNVSVKIFNLTNNIYTTDERWEPGDPQLPPPGTRWNYSLGNLYGFKMRFSWDPRVLEYVSRVVKTPVEDYPEGALHGPILVTQDELNQTAGTYSVAQSSYFYPVSAFDCPDSNATVFVLTFRVKRVGFSYLQLDNVELIPDPALVVDFHTIPFLALNPGVFFADSATRIATVEVGTLVDTWLYNPVILGENASVRFTMENMGHCVDHFNVTLYRDGVPLTSWMNESLDSGENRFYNFTFSTEGWAIGLHTVESRASILHEQTELVDSFAVNFILISSPSLSVSSSTDKAYENETVILSAVEILTEDPNLEIRNYTWRLYEPGASTSVYEYSGKSVTHTFAKNGTWRIELVIEDNWDITYNPLRTATVFYKEEIVLEVHAGEKPSSDTPVLSYEQTLIIVGLASFAVASFIVYFATKK